MQTLFFKNRSGYNISNKMNFKTKIILRDEEEYYIMILETIYQKDIMNLNVNAQNNKALKYMKQRLIRQNGEINA